jgi:hypothetical protein
MAIEFGAFAPGEGPTATSNPRSDTVVLNIQVSNTGDRDHEVVGFTTANLTFSQSNGLSAKPRAVERRRTVQPMVTIQNNVWSEERLISPRQTSDGHRRAPRLRV